MGHCLRPLWSARAQPSSSRHQPSALIFRQALSRAPAAFGCDPSEGPGTGGDLARLRVRGLPTAHQALLELPAPTAQAGGELHVVRQTTATALDVFSRKRARRRAAVASAQAPRRLGRMCTVTIAACWRREWDSNPRHGRTREPDFESGAFDHSAISPLPRTLARGGPARAVILNQPFI